MPTLSRELGGLREYLAHTGYDIARPVPEQGQLAAGGIEAWGDGGIQTPRATVVLYEEHASSWCRGGVGSCEEGGCHPRPTLLLPVARRASPRRRRASKEKNAA
jgi:hypothetical protein